MKSVSLFPRFRFLKPLLIPPTLTDPVEFNRRCDASLPLESLLTPNPNDRALLESIDRSKATVWGLTNAYVDHARRVLKILQLDDLVEGIVSCDYLRPDFPCKPEAKYYHEVSTNVPPECFA